ncbi:MAG TPA: class IV adenylate cyclase [Burkholderiaceae bacterium]|nr:class IV adenylate cyclase [Burkholderiaceae bacterium]HNB47281.1 class IV adenylate cyclase [Burkholderiaceae bacterium]HNG81694.1 class IV adenylate cyclase [Burkholderiaceae bacterium]
MARNIEIKARIANVEALLPRALALGDGTATRIAQDDTFFVCDRGRLKLRAFADGTGELIHYQRADEAGPKASDYVVAPVTQSAPLREALDRALGTHGRVVKLRTLVVVGATRIHLDRVEGLGDFLELEVVLTPERSDADGQAEAQRVMDALGIAPGALLQGAYLDLLERQRSA